MSSKNEHVQFETSNTNTAKDSEFSIDSVVNLYHDSRKKAGKKLIILDVWIILHIAMIVIGSLYLKQCPAEKYIPIYLIVGGVLGSMKNISNFIQYMRSRDDDDDEFPSYLHDKILNAFLFCWFIAGCVWIYKAYEPEFEDNTKPNYCNKVLYLFSFWLTTITLILLGSVMILSCIFVCCFFCACTLL